MNHDHLIHAMGHLDHRLIEEAAQTAGRKKHNIPTMLLAACLCLAIIFPAMAAGTLLVRHSHGADLPDHLAAQGLDAYYEILNPQKLPPDTFSQAAQTGADQLGFPTWEALEDYLGCNIWDNTLLSQAEPYAIPLTDREGKVMESAPCLLTLSRSPQGDLHAVHAHYFCTTDDNVFLSVTASALTELSDDDSAGSLAIDYGDEEILSQTSETYLTKTGRQATLITTQLSTETWDIDGWIQQNGFVIRITLTTTNPSAAPIRQILDSFAG